MRKALAWIAGIIVAVLLFAWVAYKRDDYQTFKADLSSYEGVEIGSTKDEVRYAIGLPKAVYGPEHWDADHKWRIRTPVDLTPSGDLPGTPSNPPGGSALRTSDDWIYEAVDNFTVTFDPKTQRVSQVQCLASDDPYKPCSSNLWISSYTSEEGISEQLGTPAVDKVEGGFKTIEYPDLGLRLMLAKREVYSVAKTKPKDAGFLWWLRHRLI